jgi:hypothetical protein
VNTSTGTQPEETARARDVPIRVRYLALGLIMGGIWAANHGAPLWEHVVKLLILTLAVPPLLHVVRTRRRRRQGLGEEARLSFPRLIGLKVSLVACALIAAWLLGDRVTGADFLIAGGLGLTVALLGPRLHARLLIT